MTLLEEYSPIIGMLVLAFVIIVLFSTPSMILAKEITIVGSDLATSENAIPVRTKMDFGDKEKVRNFPTLIGNYSGVDCDTSGLTERLKADVTLMRSYRSPPGQIFLLILQSKNRSSFHPPTVCYPALGYEIEEESTAEIVIHNESWIEAGPWREAEKSTVSLKVKKLVVSNGEERRMVLYFYVKPPLLSDEITLIRISALTFGEEEDEKVLTTMKEFTSEIFPLMFEYREEHVIATHLLGSGLLGWITLVLLFSFPILIALYPRIFGWRSNEP
ncbi:MAG: exosortase-associated EpsI family protein [Methanophagales archaeon]|nr:exosortase-associated EpsI family protein [Methanophagales archaeon]